MPTVLAYGAVTLIVAFVQPTIAKLGQRVSEEPATDQFLTMILEAFGVIKKNDGDDPSPSLA